MSVLPFELTPARTQSKLLAAATVPAVTVREVKDHLRLIENAEDGWIGTMIAAISEACEEWAQVALVSQSWAQVFDGVPAEAYFYFHRSPVISVTSFKWYTDAGVEADVPTASYTTDLASRWPRICINTGSSWPSAPRPWRSMVLTFVAGFGTSADAVPQRIRTAIVKAVAQQYRSREPGAVLLTPELKLLLAPYRRDWL